MVLKIKHNYVISELGSDIFLISPKKILKTKNKTPLLGKQVMGSRTDLGSNSSLKLQKICMFLRRTSVTLGPCSWQYAPKCVLLGVISRCLSIYRYSFFRKPNDSAGVVIKHMVLDLR